MPEKEIDCIRVGKITAIKRNWKEIAAKACKYAVDSIGTCMALVGAGCFIGIGLGGGLALATALWF